MNPEAVAIRLDPLKVGPENLMGKTPIVVFGEQGMLGATLPPRPGAGSIAVQQHSSLQFEIDDFMVILDKSGSMKEEVTPGAAERKLAHVQTLMAQLGEDYFPNARLKLIVLDDEAREIPLNGSQGCTSLQEAIAALTPEGGTNFSNALELAHNAVAADPAASSPDSIRERRKVVLFITDGQDDHHSRQRAGQIAASLRGQNAGVFIIGVGADYELPNLFNLAGKFGFAGWAHTPMPGNQNVFNFLLPSFLKEIQANEHYLEIQASGSIEKFYGLTPSIREAQEGVFYIGYQNQGIGICFVESAEVDLKLRVKSYQGDRAGVETEIPIIDHDDAAAHFEKLQIAKGALGPLLVLLAQLNHDRELLQKLGDEYTTLQGPIAELLENMGQQHDARARMTTHATLSSFGSMTYSGTRAGSQVNAFSRVPHSRPADSLPGGPRDRHLHSGGLGGLDVQPPESIPAMGIPNAADYSGAVPAGHPKLCVNNGSIQAEFDLLEIADGQRAVVGRKSDCQLRIAGHPEISDRHLQIRRQGSDFYIQDLQSNTGTWLNGKIISAEAKLAPGDIIQIGQVRIVFLP